MVKKWEASITSFRVFVYISQNIHKKIMRGATLYKNTGQFYRYEND